MRGRVRLPKRSARRKRAFRTGIYRSRRSGRRGTRVGVHAISAAAVGASTRRLQPPLRRLQRVLVRAVFFEITLMVCFGGIERRSRFDRGRDRLLVAT